MSIVLSSKELGNGMFAQAVYRDNELRVEMVLRNPHTKDITIINWFPGSESKALKRLNGLKRITERNVKTEFQKYVDSADEIIRNEVVTTYKARVIKKRSSSKEK